MGRLTLFVKGNVDVHDTLHSCVVGGVLQWNGINEIIRTRYPGTVIRIRHETWTRSDALLAATGHVPEILTAQHLPLGTYPLASQFSTALFTAKADAVILSIQADITSSLMRHKSEGFLFYPDRLDRWTQADKTWLREAFDRVVPLDAAASMRNLAEIIARIRQTSDAPILIFNLSPVVPGEAIHCFEGMGETYSTRVRQFNLALIALSEETGVSIVDVDMVIARGGADALKIDTMHLSPAGYERLADEVVRVLADYGLFVETPETVCASA